ncbi:leucine/isoleucine/valine transporter ATP-binding subunit [Methylobacterium variabile]|jgi:branched-chain amino acid transport system ATP-binding protein|uniref:Leucine/isoleucine/valine transporter ATP-binding subunit n=1 Tax=Methylobacterium variabile TaxID=298794 RepID=A0A0J6V0A8_9HYPH|nr:ABC transporter ATP-binding protein [Methylobacterium variabile]KMO32211.1 leucine/isoleucine/valine transporter ATP-binding subunit [Methylobacterium variabile]
MADLLELDDICAGYGRIEALSGVSLRVPEGGIVALLGANGAGKTTTLNVVSGIVAPTRGEVRLAGRSLRGLGSDAIVAAGISQVPEGREIFRDMSVHENLVIGAHARRDKAGIARDIEVMTGYFPILAKRFRQMAGTMSGGEQQMLLIARALMARPKLLLLDEPSLGLSPLLVQQIFDIIVRLHRDEKLTLLIVEQNAAVALAVSDYAYILENGEVVAKGPSAVLAADDSLRAAYLGA